MHVFKLLLTFLRQLLPDMVSEVLSWMKASYNALLSILAAFPFDTPDYWPKWKHRFQQYHLASGLLWESEEREVNILLYCLGKEAEDILASTNIGEEGRKKYDSAGFGKIWQFL